MTARHPRHPVIGLDLDLDLHLDHDFDKLAPRDRVFYYSNTL